MGAINLDNTGSGSSITLSSDGTSLLLGGSAVGGGGGADLYAANESSPGAQPSATGTNSVSIGDGAVSSGEDSLAGPNSRATATGAFAAALSNNSATYGAQGQYSVALGERSKASGYASVALAHGTATGDLSMAVNTSNSGYASNGNSFAFGSGCQASQNPSISLGSECTSSGQASVSLGTRCESSGVGSFSCGSGGKAQVAGKFAFGGTRFTVNGDSQSAKYLMKKSTTDATSAEMVAGYDGSSVYENRVMTLENYSAHAFEGRVVARQKGSEGTDCAAWNVAGLIRREANAASTTLVTSTVTTISNTPSWTLSLSANTSVGSLAVTVAGASSHTLRWTSDIDCTEIIYS